MKPLVLPSLCLLGLLAGSAHADDSKSPDNTAQADDNACTWFNTLDDWHALDDRHLIVWASRKEFYQLELGMPLIDLRSADAIAFIDSNRDGRICGFGMDEIVVPRSVVFGHSTIMGMTRLDDAGLAALAEKYHVKLGIKKKPHASDKKPAEPVATAKG